MTPASNYYPDPQHYEFDLFGERVCPACGETLPANADYFTTDRSRCCGLSSQCRRCHNERSRRSYQERRGRVAS